MQMRPELFPTMSPLLLFIISTFIILIHNFPMCHGVDDEQFTNCSRSYTCANREISYPFWGGDRPDYCGYPGFELTCSGDAPEITMASLSYRMLGIDNSTDTVTLARNDYLQNLCPPSYVNVTLDFSILTYASNTKNVSLYYQCPALPTSGLSLPTGSIEFNCGNNISYYLTSPEIAAGNTLITAYLSSCNSTVRVPGIDSRVNELQNNITSTEEVIQVLNDGFGLVWEANNTACRVCAGSGGTCGSQAGTTEFTCYCRGGPNATMCDGTSQTPAPADNKLDIKKRVTIIGIGGSVAISILLICFFGRKFWLKKIRVLWRKEIEGDQDVEEFIRKCGSLAPKRYSYSDVKKMTNSFKDKLGQGGFGQVYKGQLRDGRVVAVKVLSESKGNGEEFMNEVASISRTSHVNIVALSGFCYQRTKRALIYEFMRNGSLDKFIYDGPDKTSHPLGWEMLYQIALGIARGLEYLHRGCNTRILHFDIKPHNILLDEDFCPKISDFGLAKLCQMKESIISLLGARGTAGYIAPEVFSRNFGGVSHKSDVYSYGMMVLEMVGARKKIEIPGSGTSEIYFPHWIYKQLDLGMDLIHDGVMTEKEGEISRKLVLVGLWCIQTIPSDRPSVNKVIEMLEGSLQSLQVPPKPFLSSPPRQPRNSSTTSSMIDDSS